MGLQIKSKGASLAIAVGTLLAGAPAAEATTIFGITEKKELAKFDSKNPANVKTTKLRGLRNGVELVGIDQRPSNGKLYGIGDNSTVYRISARAKTIKIGDGFDNVQLMPPSPGVALEGDSFGVDFNPVPDAIRIVSNTGQNLRVSPETGDLISEDGEINGANASIVDAAYTSSRQSSKPPEAATLYVLDARKDRVYTQNPPNDGTLTNPVNLDINITRTSGFDLVGSGRKGFIADSQGENTKLYRVRGETTIGLRGDTKKLGTVRAGSKLTALAVDQPQVYP
ncbi:MAG: DUF4394 domain-containing protein [Actinomycetota bacterium]|nr:DUF4394 domain-containing protein [Actinomycetota bacterium]